LAFFLQRLVCWRFSYSFHYETPTPTLLINIAHSVVLTSCNRAGFGTQVSARNRDIGLVWLGVAVVIWPLVSVLLQNGESVVIDGLVRGRLVGFYPFSLAQNGQMTIGSLVAPLGFVHQLIEVKLLVVAVVFLHRAKSNDRLPAAS
jgi:hypothetical protein